MKGTHVAAGDEREAVGDLLATGELADGQRRGARPGAQSVDGPLGVVAATAWSPNTGAESIGVVQPVTVNAAAEVGHGERQAAAAALEEVRLGPQAPEDPTPRLQLAAQALHVLRQRPRHVPVVRSSSINIHFWCAITHKPRI